MITSGRVRVSKEAPVGWQPLASLCLGRRRRLLDRRRCHRRRRRRRGRRHHRRLRLLQALQLRLRLRRRPLHHLVALGARLLSLLKLISRLLTRLVPLHARDLQQRARHLHVAAHRRGGSGDGGGLPVRRALALERRLRLLARRGARAVLRRARRLGF